MHQNTRMMMGINSFDFSWELAPRECFYSPVSYTHLTLLGSLVYGDLQGNCPNMMIPLKFEHQLLEFKNKKIYLEEF